MINKEILQEVKDIIVHVSATKMPRHCIILSKHQLQEIRSEKDRERKIDETIINGQ